MTVWILPIEGHEQRYTAQWLHHLPVQLAQAAAARGVPASVIQIEGEIPPPVPLAGAFLDFAGTNIFKSTQIAEVARRFPAGGCDAGRHVPDYDAWHPGVHQIRYMSALLRIPVRVVGLFHAGHYDPNDFLGRIASGTPRGRRPWSERCSRPTMSACSRRRPTPSCSGRGGRSGG